MAIYTRTGDHGTTSLGSGKKVSKDSCNVESYGTIDELNSLLGLIYSEIDSKDGLKGVKNLREKASYKKYMLQLLIAIQSDMLCIGAYLANPKLVDMIGHFTERIKKFEHEIDFMMGKIPPLTNFIFPQGGRVGSLFQLARTVSRRAERTVVTYAKEVADNGSDEMVDDRVLAYVNRLSDLMLAAARYTNHLEKKKEIIWSREKYIK